MIERNKLVQEVRQDNLKLWSELSKDPDPFNSFCRNGKLGNYYLLLGLPVPQELEDALKDARREYWLQTQPKDELLSKCQLWLMESQESINLGLELNDNLGLNRDKYWLAQDIWLMEEAEKLGILEVLPIKKEALKLLVDLDNSSFDPSKIERGVLLSKVIETTYAYKDITHNIVRKWIYGVNVGNGDIAPAEVLYTGLDVGKPESQRSSVLCLPLSIGCPGKCLPCEVGNYYVRQLTGEQMLTMAFRTVKGYSLPRLFPANLKISWLGGGDPAYNFEEFSKAVKRMHDFYSESTQVVSTIGVSEQSLGNLDNLSIEIPTVSLQYSILSMDNEERTRLAGGKKVLNTDSLLKRTARNFSERHQKTYISLFLTQGHSSEEEIVTKLAENGITPEKVHITLDLPAAFHRSNARIVTPEKYEGTLLALKRFGYDAHIYKTEELEFEAIGGCGTLTLDSIKILKEIAPH